MPVVRSLSHPPRTVAVVETGVRTYDDLSNSTLHAHLKRAPTARCGGSTGR